MDLLIEGCRKKLMTSLPSWVIPIVMDLKTDHTDYLINVEKLRPSLYRFSCKQTKRYALLVKTGKTVLLNICALAEPDLEVSLHPHHVLLHQEVLSIGTSFHRKVFGLIKTHVCNRGTRHKLFKRIKVSVLQSARGGVYGGRIKDVVRDEYFHSITTYDQIVHHIPTHLARDANFTTDHYLVMTSDTIFAVHPPGVFNDYYEFV
jgi:hypothetical protein